MRVVVEIIVCAGSLSKVSRLRLAARTEALTVSRAYRNARVQVAICTMHATTYANWYGITVETRNNRMLVVIIRRFGVCGARVGNTLLLKHHQY